MSKSSSSSSSSGIGILGLLGVVFVTLKLVGYIEWSWWWVTLPFWGGFALAVFIGLSLLIWYVISEGRDQKIAQKRLSERAEKYRPR